MTYHSLAKIFEDKEVALQYFIDKGLFSTKKCWSCKSTMSVNTKKALFICKKKQCRKSVSIYKNTFFSTCRIPLNTLCWICYMYLNKMPIDSIIKTSGVRSESITAWTSFIRQLVSDSLDEEEIVIGGPGIIVEIDETKLGKRKYNRGHRVEGVWTIAGIERTYERKIFLINVPDRTTETISKVISSFVLPGSIIYTDGWAAYVKACDDLGFEHHTVEHKYFFKDPITGVHTNTVEGLNNGIKHLIKPRNRTKKTLTIIYFILFGDVAIKETYGMLLLSHFAKFGMIKSLF